MPFDSLQEANVQQDFVCLLELVEALNDGTNAVMDELKDALEVLGSDDGDVYKQRFDEAYRQLRAMPMGKLDVESCERLRRVAYEEQQSEEDEEEEGEEEEEEETEVEKQNPGVSSPESQEDADEDEDADEVLLLTPDECSPLLMDPPAAAEAMDSAAVKTGWVAAETGSAVADTMTEAMDSAVAETGLAAVEMEALVGTESTPMLKQETPEQPL